MNFYSQLFPKIVTPLIITQNIIKESPDSIISRNAGTAINNKDIKEIALQYDERYKPAIGYKFSGYTVDYNAEIAINTTDKHIEHADVRIKEYVANNVELDISCRIRRKI